MPRVYTYVLYVVLPAVLILSSCSQVKFSANSSDEGGGGTPVVPQGGSITCSPLLNGGVNSVTLTAASSNPSLDANCVPTSVTYGWSVTRSGVPVTINGLTGASSIPDFLSAGPGTYLIGLHASATGYTSFTLGTPLQVIVATNPPQTDPDLICAPKINGTLTSITLLTAANPNISANCTPSSASYVWTVRQGTTIVTVPGLSGSTSTPDFHSMGAGVYEVWLQASKANYNNYSSTAPLKITVPASSGTLVDETINVTTANNKLDILLVVDDSASMLKDNQKLAARLQGFVNDLSSRGFDWQMCLTLTRAMQVGSGSTYKWGASWEWSGNPNSPKWILKSGTAGINNIFANTIDDIGAGWANTDDERAIKAAYNHVYHGAPTGPGSPSGCYRANAGLSVIILSDEDEGSIGGDITQAYYKHEKDNVDLEFDDMPQNYVNYVKQSFGNSKRFTVNSIIVRPGDTSCMAKQDAAGSKSHYGTKYKELSNLTNGYVGSICSADYANELNYFKNAIINNLASVPLQCTTPVSSVNVTVTPAGTYSTNNVSGNLIFTPPVPAGSTIRLKYTCP